MSAALPDSGKGYLNKTTPLYSVPNSCFAHLCCRNDEGGTLVTQNAVVVIVENAAGTDWLRIMYLDAPVIGVMVGTAVEGTAAEANLLPVVSSSAIFFSAATREASLTDRAAYVNSNPVPATSVVADVLPVSPDHTAIGSSFSNGDNEHHEGSVMHLAIWNIDVGENILKQLMLGSHPFFVCPRGMVAFLPLEDAQATVDWIGSYWSILGTSPTFNAGGQRPFQLDRQPRMRRNYGRAALAREALGRRVAGW